MLVRIGLVLGLAALAALARDGKAAKLAAKAGTLGKKGEEAWKKYVLDRANFSDKELAKLIRDYEDSIELYHQSLEIEEHAGLNGQIVVMARRIAKLRFEQVRRKAAKHPKKPKPKPQPKPKPRDPKEKPEPEPEPKPKPEPEPEPEPERDAGEGSPWPELKEDKKAERRGKQSLRNFLMHYYFANRKFSSLIIRCTRCNGHRRIPIGKDPRTRKIIFGDCPACNATGAHLNVTNARKAYWLIWSPLYRSNPENRARFEQSLAEWRERPAKIGEFLKSLSIGTVDYRGLWAVVTYVEKGSNVNTRRKFSRKVQRMFVRLGKRWFVYDEKFDKDWFAGTEPGS